MPIYPYKCDTCIDEEGNSLTKEVNAKMTEEHEPPMCDKCNETMVRDWSQNRMSFTFGSTLRTNPSINEQAAEMAEKRANANIEAEKKKYKSRYHKVT